MLIRISRQICFLVVVLAGTFGPCQYLGAPAADHPEQVDKIIAESSKRAAAEPGKAADYLDSAFRQIKKPGINDQYARLEFKRTLYADSLNELEPALKAADSVLTLLKPVAKKATYQIKYAEAHLARGNVLFRMHLFNEAYAAYFDGRSALDQVLDKCERSHFLFLFYRQLGDISFGKGSFKEAAEWQKRALGALSSCSAIKGRTELTQGALDNIALSYDLAGYPDTALVYYNKALKFVGRVEHSGNNNIRYWESAKGVILGNRGNVFGKQKKFSLAEADYLKSIEINSKPGYELEDALITRGKLADLYLKTGRLSAAGRQIGLIEIDKDKVKQILIQQQLRKLRGNYQTATGNVAAANLEFKKYISVSDSVRKANRALFATSFSTEFELLKRQYDLEKLSRRNEMQGFYLSAAIIGCLLAALIVYLVTRNARQNKRNAVLLTQHNLKLESTLSALEKSNTENSQLTSIVAHDLKNPVSAIIGISALLLEEEIQAETREMLELIKASGENLNRVIHDTLSARLNHINSDTSAIKAAVYDVVNQSVSLLRFRAEEKRQRIIVAKPDDTYVKVNGEKIWRVINNLIVNAIKFSPENTSIHIYWRIEEKMVIVSIKDQGIGVPEALRDKIFQLTTEAKRAGTSGEQTFGLGLFISRQLVEDQGGLLWLENDSSNGATFSFSLPLCE